MYMQFALTIYWLVSTLISNVTLTKHLYLYLWHITHIHTTCISVPRLSVLFCYTNFLFLYQYRTVFMYITVVLIMVEQMFFNCYSFSKRVLLHIYSSSWSFYILKRIYCSIILFLSRELLTLFLWESVQLIFFSLCTSRESDSTGYKGIRQKRFGHAFRV